MQQAVDLFPLPSSLSPLELVPPLEPLSDPPAMPFSVSKKDAPKDLPAVKRSRRRPGEVPYPLEYSNSMVDFDIWENMFFVSCCRGVSMHEFEKPPEVILDVGCGGGYWALEAAKHWENATIIGFDLANVQPNLQELEQYRHLARRVKWAHGNMLDGLPFPSSQFDFVRMSFVGLGVPEDEWQYLLEEIVRVLKPGGYFELLEEDLIFPCATMPQPDPSLSPKLGNLDLSFNPGASSSSTLVNEPSFLNHDPSKSLNSPLRTMYQGLSRKSTSRLKLPQHPSEASLGSHSCSTSVSEGATGSKHPQDHSRLKAAWERMLDKRFLCQKILSVLPFYVSSFFSDVKAFPPYNVYLPPNSNATLPLRSRHSAESFRPSSRGAGLDVPFDFTLPVPGLQSKGEAKTIHAIKNLLAGPQRWTAMHLSRSMNTITACKAHIWKEYEDLHRRDWVENYSQTEVSLRQLFDRDWAHWQNDMLDRLNFRDRIGHGLMWPETPGERPDCRKWRSEFDPSLGGASPPKLVYEPTDLCRTVRPFIGRKAL